MAKSVSAATTECLNIDFMRSLVKQYSELGQWTSALFWADVAAAACSGMGQASGDDIWLLASAMLARGELHRAAHAVTSRALHRRHLLCLGVVMRAYLAAKEPATALNMMDECDPALLEPRNTDQTHNRALAGVLVWQARALSALERREAAAEALAAALRADCASYEALDLLLDQHALTPAQELELISSLPVSSQLGVAEGALVRLAYRERALRYTPEPLPPSSGTHPPGADTGGGASTEAGVEAEVEEVRSRTLEASVGRARRLAAGGRWREALAALQEPWGAAAERVACLVELRRSAELFAFAHELVDAYPQEWTSWFAVGCYYYLIGKSELARRYLSKAKTLEPGAGCVWLAYGHSFAADNEHDQAMAAYFKASQLMSGCHVPPLYVGVECSLLNNPPMCAKFLARAAALHAGLHTAEQAGPDAGRGARQAGQAVEAEEAEEAQEEAEAENKGRWECVVRCVQEPHVAHEAGVAAFAAGDYRAARALLTRALDAARGDRPVDEVGARWAPTLDALGHAWRALGAAGEALGWHARALARRPARGRSHAARGLCLALLGRRRAAARALHRALAADPDDVVAHALLDAVLDRLHDDHAPDEEIPQFPFPELNISPAAPATPAAAPASADVTGAADVTNMADMSMSFD
ncbi:cell division cycle protein 16 homolog [Galleria mellonella]|uniref:Cell division cycle protein 16 homolog n=1 Tax=Galleria mellonella TaxID=7137 RepID=A0ABM3N3L5_GALME|nr:cell division cycle protein 16 homolog [Galleria mellonella]